MELTQILLLIAVFIVSALIKGWSGFGTNLLALPILVMLGYEVKEAVTIVITVNVFFNLTMILTSKKLNIKSLQSIGVLLLFGIVFTFVGQVLLKNANPSVLKIILGIAITLTVLNKAAKYSFTVSNKEKWYIPVGIISGLLNGMAGLGGLPVLILLSNSEMEQDEFKQTLVTYFFAMNLIAVTGFIANGLYSPFVFENIAYAIIPGIIFVLLGIVLSRKVSDTIFQKVMLLILLALGLKLGYDGVSALI